MRPEAPARMDTAAFGTPKRSATSTMSSALALPSTGGDLSRASQVPSGSGSSEETRAFGLTLIWSVRAAMGDPICIKYRMSLKRAPELHAFLSTYVMNGSPETDEQAARGFAAASPPERVQRALAQARELLPAPPLDELGAEANRWFGDAEEAAAWLRSLIAALESSAGESSGAGIVVKDSNGTPLSEGDAVTVIKDLKVKGGSSDLKRGTLVKKIHLTDDPEHVECRVEGTALVLKTCFLKKA